MNPKFRVLFASILLFAFSSLAYSQQLPNLPNKPTPQFENPSFCPQDGKAGSPDPELNRRKNRIDDSASFFPVTFSVIATLTFPKGVSGTVRSNWSTADQKAIAKNEGIPIMVEGFLALVNNAKPSDPPNIQGARPEGKESCNCDSTQDDQIDFHIWLLNAAGVSRAGAIVVEMTPRVRSHHPTWTVDALTNIANKKFPVRISGWLMLDGQHPEQIGKTRASLWEIHPIMKVQFKQNGQWKTL
jgi:hypothetical protein